MNNQITLIESVFWIVAAISTFFFIVRTVMMLFGFGAHHLDTAIDHNFDAVDSDSSFNILSINTITVFFMMFGWVGLACLNQFNLNDIFSVMIAVLSGLFSMFITAFLFKYMSKLQSAGGGVNLDSLIGQKAKVYVKVAPQSVGKVQVYAGGMLREFYAVSSANEEINSFEYVIIDKIIDESTVSVKKINNFKEGESE